MINLLLTKSGRARCDQKNFRCLVGVDRDVKECTVHIQAQYVILGTDHRLEHVKVLVGCLTLDRVLVEATEDMHDVLVALARRSVNP